MVKVRPMVDSFISVTTTSSGDSSERGTVDSVVNTDEWSGSTSSNSVVDRELQSASPGPGQYSLPGAIGTETGGPTIKGRLVDYEQVHQSYKPGPGHYDHNSSLTGPKHVFGTGQ